jgi:hypothetical protein
LNQLEVVGINFLTKQFERSRIEFLQRTCLEYNAHLAHERIDLLSLVQIPPMLPGSRYVFALHHIQDITQAQGYGLKKLFKQQLKIFVFGNLIILPLIVFLEPNQGSKVMLMCQMFLQLVGLIYNICTAFIDDRFHPYNQVVLDMKKVEVDPTLECSICLEEVSKDPIDPNNEHIAPPKLLGHMAYGKIMHIFHAKCLKPLLKAHERQSFYFQCPICRQYVLEKPVFYVEKEEIRPFQLIIDQ